jgi:RNA polymerase sigma-70 factor (ECF subfamily)
MAMGRDAEPPAGGDADVGAAVRGDREAFARLYRRFARPVFVDLVARLGRREDAEDALQATFLSAWTSLPRLARPGRFVPWLFRIARNKARDQLRRRRQGLACVLAEDVAAAPGRGRPELEALRALVDGLQPKTRAIVMLRALEGWSAEEVAAAHRLSVATVRRRYAKALEHLRAGFERRMRDDQDTGHRAADRVRV